MKAIVVLLFSLSVFQISICEEVLQFPLDIKFYERILKPADLGRGKCPKGKERYCYHSDDKIIAKECAQRCKKFLVGPQGDGEFSPCLNGYCYCQWYVFNKVSLKMKFKQRWKLQNLEGRRDREAQKRIEKSCETHNKNRQNFFRILVESDESLDSESTNSEWDPAQPSRSFWNINQPFFSHWNDIKPPSSHLHHYSDEESE